MSRASDLTLSRNAWSNDGYVVQPNLKSSQMHRPSFVARVEQGVVLVVAAAPEAEAVHVGRHGVGRVAAQNILGQPRGEAVGRDPVGPLGEERHAVDHKVHRLLVGLFDRPQGAQANALGRRIEHLARGVEQFDLDVIQRLPAHARRPPELGVGNWNLGLRVAVPDDGRCRRHVLRAEVDGHLRGRSCRRRWGGRSGDRQGHLPRLRMVLQNGHVFQPRGIERNELDLPPDAAGDQRRPPIPAEVARLFAHVGRARVGPGRQLAMGFLVTDDGEHGIELDLDLVGAGPQVLLDVELVRAEHVVGLGDGDVVHPDGGQCVQTFATKQDMLTRQQVRRDVERSAVDPVRFAYPLHGSLVVPVERVGNLAGGHQVGVDRAGHGGRDRIAAPFLNAPARLRPGPTATVRLPARGRHSTGQLP